MLKVSNNIDQSQTPPEQYVGPNLTTSTEDDDLRILYDLLKNQYKDNQECQLSSITASKEAIDPKDFLKVQGSKEWLEILMKTNLEEETKARVSLLLDINANEDTFLNNDSIVRFVSDQNAVLEFDFGDQQFNDIINQFQKFYANLNLIVKTIKDQENTFRNFEVRRKDSSDQNSLCLVVQFQLNEQEKKVTYRIVKNETLVQEKKKIMSSQSLRENIKDEFQNLKLNEKQTIDFTKPYGKIDIQVVASNGYVEESIKTNLTSFFQNNEYYEKERSNLIIWKTQNNIFCLKKVEDEYIGVNIHLKDRVYSKTYLFWIPESEIKYDIEKKNMEDIYTEYVDNNNSFFDDKVATLEMIEKSSTLVDVPKSSGGVKRKSRKASSHDRLRNTLKNSKTKSTKK